MKSILVLGSVLVGASAFAAPKISGVTVTQEASGRVAVAYTLSEAGIVTLDSLSIGGVETAASNLTSLAGNVNKYQKQGARRFWWNPRTDFPGSHFEAQDLEFRLTAWATSRPPDYMVVRLAEKGTAKTQEFYSSESALPGGIGSDVYRTEKLVMRYIPAKNVTWLAGWDGKEQHDNVKAATTQPQRFAPHYVKLTEDFYIAVFEFTIGQSVYVLDAWTPAIEQCRKPIVGKAFDDLRGPATSVSWPEDGHEVAPDSILAKYRARTGLAFDLPTSEQWEFASRAGTSTDFFFGKYDVDQSVYGQYMWVNRGSGDCQPVGLLKANPWGLYDTLGNAWEWTLNWRDITWKSEADNWRMTDYAQREMTDNKGGLDADHPMVDPTGSATGTTGVNSRVLMGGDVTSKGNSFVYFKHQAKPDDKAAAGYRPVCPIPTFED